MELIYFTGQGDLPLSQTGGMFKQKAAILAGNILTEKYLDWCLN